MFMKTCILISTCDKYHRMANFTEGKIRELWPGHPDIYYCGLSGGGDNRLALRRSQVDWVGIQYDACADLGEKGYSAVYLILDDHPPFAKCSARHLNETLPTIMKKLDAAYIGLNGWGQGRVGRAPNGTIDRSLFGIEKVADDFKWKFSLHPALWNIDSLTHILSYLMDIHDEKARNPWAFERIAGGTEERVAVELAGKTYRICGYKMSPSLMRNMLRRMELKGAAVLCFIASKTLSNKAGRVVYEWLYFVNQYYEGPYPLFWSGFMQKGKLSDDAEKFLAARLKIGYLHELRKAWTENAAG